MSDWTTARVVRDSRGRMLLRADGHMADELGKPVVAWAMVAAAVDPESYADGRAHYWREQSDGQQLHVTEGLFRFGIRMVRDSWNDEGDA